MAQPTIQVEYDPNAPKKARIWYNGIELSNAYHIHADVEYGRPSRIRITFDNVVVIQDTPPVQNGGARRRR